MIIDKISNAHLYFNLNDNLTKGLKYLQNTNLENIQIGKDIIDGENLFASIQLGPTKNKETTPWEIHKVYTDIQYIINGAEIMGWANIENFIITEEYNKENDIAFGTANGSYITVPQGYFVIFTPNDAHQPMLKIDKIKEVKKVIVKVKC